jgi:hypothetical protein
MGDAVAVKFTVLALADIQGGAMPIIALSFKFRRHWIEAKLPLTLLFTISGNSSSTTEILHNILKHYILLITDLPPRQSTTLSQSTISAFE